MTSLLPPQPGVNDRAAASAVLDEEARARMSDPHTSHEAAAKVKLKGLQVLVLKTFRRVTQEREKLIAEGIGQGVLTGLTDEEMVAWIEGRYFDAPSAQGLRTARKALERKALVAPAGIHRKTKRGNDAEVYVITDAGRDLDLDR